MHAETRLAMDLITQLLNIFLSPELLVTAGVVLAFCFLPLRPHALDRVSLPYNMEQLSEL